mgnify:CR=1 FL=1
MRLLIIFVDKTPKTLYTKGGGECMVKEEIVMTDKEFRTIVEMLRLIVAGSKDKEEALKNIDSLTIMKDNKGENQD